jgi:hypothetical protein
MDRERLSLRLLDGSLPLAGLGLLVLGATVQPLAYPLAWAALGVAFVAWVAEADGLPIPRPGRLRISRYGCWETPLAFAVRHGGRDLLFSRDESDDGAWSSTYALRERAAVPGTNALYELPLAESGDWALRGQVPVATLRFEHHERVSYVTRRSLERALGATAVTPSL